MKLTSKSQVTIPRNIREAVGLRPGDEVEFKARKDGLVVLRKKSSGFAQWRGFTGKRTTAQIDALIRDLRGRD